MWLIFALLTPVFWSVVHVMDSHCVEEVFERPWMGIITSALTSLCVLFIIPFFLPFYSFGPIPNVSIILLAVFAGILVQISQLFYFQSLSHSEAGIVAAYWNFTPAILPVVSFIFFSQILKINAYIGISCLVIGSVLFCLIDVNFKTRWKTFFLMLIASIFQVAALLIEDLIFDHMSYIAGFFFITVGIILFGVIPLLIPRLCKAFIKNLKKLSSAMHLLFGIEVFNLCALATSQKAISLGTPSLVAAVETSVPAYTFVLSILLLQIWPKFGDTDSLNKIGIKILLVLLMGVGVWLVHY